ncbi:MAG: class I SAM-dependent methyltransferase [Planctomycetota bacterium]
METREVRVGTREGYDRWSECYDDYGNPLIALEEPVVRQLVGDVCGVELLDLACGTGRHALHFAAEGARTTGVDFSSGMLSVARERDVESRVRWLQHDLHRPLPFADASFGRVVHALALDHMKAPLDLLREMRRLLRLGGSAVVSVLHPAMFLKGTQARFVDPASGDLVVIDNERYRVSDYVNWSREAGLELVEMQERCCTAEIAARIPRAAKYVDWPMMLALKLGPGGD